MPDNYIENALNQNNETIIADFDKTTETFDINDIDLSPILSKCPCSEKSTKMYQNFYTISTVRTIAVDQEAFISRLSNKFVTSLDMTSAYFQIELSEESKPLTSFYVDTCWQRMSQGFVSAPKSFAFDNKVLSKIKTDLTET